MDLSGNYGASALPGSLGSGLYDFGYQFDNLPASGAASTAAQYDEGGSGFDWGDALGGLLDAWVKVESTKASQASAPLQYRRGEDGRVYVTDPAYRGPPGGGGSIGGIPTSWLLIGGLIFLGIQLAKD